LHTKIRFNAVIEGANAEIQPMVFLFAGVTWHEGLFILLKGLVLKEAMCLWLPFHDYGFNIYY
jgi:hypothetical protein